MFSFKRNSSWIFSSYFSQSNDIFGFFPPAALRETTLNGRGKKPKSQQSTTAQHCICNQGATRTAQPYLGVLVCRDPGEIQAKGGASLTTKAAWVDFSPISGARWALDASGTRWWPWRYKGLLRLFWFLLWGQKRVSTREASKCPKKKQWKSIEMACTILHAQI